MNSIHDKKKLLFMIFLFMWLWNNNLGMCKNTNINAEKIRKIIVKNVSVFPGKYQSFINENNYSFELVNETFFEEKNIILELTIGNENSFDHPIVFPIAIKDQKVFIFNQDYSNYQILNSIIDINKLGENFQKWITLGIYFSPYGIFASPIIADLKFKKGKTEKVIKYLPGNLKIIGDNFEFNQIYCGLFRDFFKVRIKGSLKKQKITRVEVKEINFH